MVFLVRISVAGLATVIATPSIVIVTASTAARS